MAGVFICGLAWFLVVVLCVFVNEVFQLHIAYLLAHVWILLRLAIASLSFRKWSELSATVY